MNDSKLIFNCETSNQYGMEGFKKKEWVLIMNRSAYITMRFDLKI